MSHEGEKHTGNESERKQHFLQHKGKHFNSKEAYTDGSKSTGRGALPEEASIHTTEMTAIKTAVKERAKDG